MSKAPGPVDVHTIQVLLGVGVGVETHGAKETRQTEQVVSMQVRDENLGDSACVDKIMLLYTGVIVERAVDV